MPDRPCAAYGCQKPVVDFPCFPTVVGYCLTHGNAIANFRSLIDCGGPCGFDGSRARWENIARRRDGVDA